MTVIYVAGPMTGLPDYNLPAFAAATFELDARGRRTRGAVALVGPLG